MRSSNFNATHQGDDSAQSFAPIVGAADRHGKRTIAARLSDAVACEVAITPVHNIDRMLEAVAIRILFDVARECGYLAAARLAYRMGDVLADSAAKGRKAANG